MTQTNAKQKSRDYFNSHRKSRLAHGGYWRHDYRYQLKAHVFKESRRDFNRQIALLQQL